MCVLTNENATCICQDGKPVKPNYVCTPNILNDAVNFASNATDIRSRSIRHYSSTYSGIFIALIIIILVLCGYYYYQKHKLKMTALNNLRYVPNLLDYY